MTALLISIGAALLIGIGISFILGSLGPLDRLVGLILIFLGFYVGIATLVLWTLELWKMKGL